MLEGAAPQLARQMAADLGWELVVHHLFGTATVTHNGCSVDLVTARRETYSAPGALPQVDSGALSEDLARRDFSINTLALPLYQAEPEVLDEQGGIADLEKGLIRTLHHRSFIDDPTRVLRAVRYEQRLGFALDPATEGQLQQALSPGCLDSVSGDRLRHELKRILEEKSPGPALVRAISLGILPAIHPALTDQSGLASLDAQSGDENAPEPPAYLAALVYRLSPVDADSVVQRFNMSGQWAELVRDTVALRELEPQLSAASLRPSQIVGLLAGLGDAAVVSVAYICDSRVVSHRLGQYLSELRQIVPALDGDSLQAMGVPPGPIIGKILGKLRDAKLDGLVQSEEEERQLVATILAGGVDD